MRLIDPIKRALVEEKYETPTPVQAQAIPAALRGEDILAVAQTGTGKTAAFALPLLSRIAESVKGAQILCLAPPRALALEVAEASAGVSRFDRILIMATSKPAAPANPPATTQRRAPSTDRRSDVNALGRTATGARVARGLAGS